MCDLRTGVASVVIAGRVVVAHAQHPEMVARMREQLGAIVGSDDSPEADELLGAETLHE